MNSNPSGLDPTARSFTGQYSQLPNQGNVYQMGSNLTGLQHLQGLHSQLGARGGFGGMPASSSQPGERFQNSFNQLNQQQYQQAQTRHPGLALGNYAPNPGVRNQLGGNQLGLQSQLLGGNRPLMGTNLAGGFGGVSQNPQGLQGMPLWSTSAQQSMPPSNLHSLSPMNRMQGLNQQQQQLAQARPMNTLGQNINRDLNSAALSGLLQHNPNPSQDLLSMMKHGTRTQQQNQYGLMSQMPQLQASSSMGVFGGGGGRSALPLERPGEQGMNASAMNGLRFDASEFPSLSGVNSASSIAARTNALTLSSPGELDMEKSVTNKEEYPALPAMVENQSLKASVHGPIGRSQPPIGSAPLPLEPVNTSTAPAASSSQGYFHGSHNMPASVQDSLKNIQAGRTAKSPPPLGGRAPTTPQRVAGSLMLQLPQQMDPSCDRFSLVGLNSVIRTVDEDLAMLALGLDLTQLGLKLEDPGNKLHKTFISPWADHQAPGDPPDFEIPASYKNAAEKLRPEHLAKFRDETLFYVFYSSPGEVAQALASATLSSRGLTWHKDRKQWFTRVPNTNPQKSPDGERGSYIFFDTNQWKYVQKDNFLVKYEAIESATALPRVQNPIAMK